MRIDGHCHCGAISFEAEITALEARLCHCVDCQRLSGSAFRANVQAPASGFNLRGSTLRSYIKTAESGARRRHAFCGDCGTPIYACAEVDPESYSLRLGTITQRAAFKPMRQIWRRSALPWVDAIGGIATSDKG
jgi:hypothetical protein